VARRTDRLDLGRLALSPGEGRRLDIEVALDPLELAGERYGANPSSVPARLDVTRTLGGYSLRLRYSATISGPCMRCLEDAHPRFDVDAREVDQPGGGEELESPYVANEELDVHAWARDALALELPAQIVCDEACRGICSICGENLNTADASHHHEAPPDPRWAKLHDFTKANR
jgi:uncharacterized protein